MGHPLLYVFVLGFGLNPVYRQSGQGDYFQFIAPGIIGMAILFSAFLSGMRVLYDRQYGFLRASLAAPVPRAHIMLGRSLGGAAVALLQGGLVLAACCIGGFRPQTLGGVVQALCIMTLIALVFASLGTAIGAMLRDQQGFQLVMSFCLMPLFFLSGALFPLSDLPRTLTLATRLDPLTYGIDALRGALIGSSYIGSTINLAVLAMVLLVTLAIGSWAFARIET